jgi:hypothetical protein
MRSIPLVHRTVWKIREAYNRAKRLLLVRRPMVMADDYLKHAILQKRPYAAGKMGSTESLCLSIFLKREKARAKNRKIPAYNPYIFHTLFINSGVFPQNAEMYDQFCLAYRDAVKQCDMLVAWDVAGEAQILSLYCPDTTLVRFRSLEPFFSPHPWTSALKGKRVLVVSPFVDSIRKQYARRETLWNNPEILPAFELLTLKAPLSAGLVAPQDADWFAALERMKKEMSALDYDVALIGAGAFSIPLAVFAKEHGKVGIHLGGSLQILFGISGERWKKDDAYKGFIKQNWIGPSKEETPQDVKKIEEGCYW